ncbi:MAG: hypothetical protein AB1679_02490 [Actinomycetota bacterium]|jgi:hypothetical protein
MVHVGETQDQRAAALRRLYVALQRAQNALWEAHDALRAVLCTRHPPEKRPGGAPMRSTRTSVWEALIDAELKHGSRVPNVLWFPHRLDAHLQHLRQIRDDNRRLCIHVGRLLRICNAETQAPHRTGSTQLRALAHRLRPKAPSPSPRAQEGTGAASPPTAVGPNDRRREVLALNALHPELQARVMTATAHAPIRVVERFQGEAGEEFEVFAVAGDEFVHMSLSLRPDGSVAETTQTALRAETEVVAVGTDHATVRIPDDVVAVPLEIASAIRETSGQGR